MKILFCTRDDTYHIPNQLYYFKRNLAKKVEVLFFGPDYPEHNFKVVEKERPDIVVLNYKLHSYAKHIYDDLDKYKVPRIIFRMEDVHRRILRRIKYINTMKVDLITSPLIEELNPFREMINARIEFVPHSVNLDFFKPLYEDEDRKHDVIFRGAMARSVYRFRKRLHAHLKDHPTIKYGWKPRPGGGYKLMNAQEEMVEYAEAVANSKIFAFGVGRYRKALNKYWEAGACKTMVMSNRPYDMDENHLYPDKNFILINIDNFKEKIDYYLENDKERKRLQEELYKTTVKYHDTDKVVDYFIKLLEELI